MIPIGVIASAYRVTAPAVGQSQDLLIASGTVSADLTGFVVRIDLADMPSAWWAPGVTAGGIRVSSGGSALPVDVVHVDNILRQGDIYVQVDVPTGSATTLTVSHDPELSAPAVTDPIGRNAVWADYEAVIIDTPVDRTGSHSVVKAEGDPEKSVTLSRVSGVVPNAHQGVAVDDSYWYIIDTNQVTKYSRADWSIVATNTDLLATAGLTTPYNHFGDGAVYGGLLYLGASEYPVDVGAESIVVFDASDLSFVAKYDVTSTGHQLASLHVDGDGYLYSVGYNSGPAYETSIVQWTMTGSVNSIITLPSEVRYMQGVTRLGSDWWLSSAGINQADLRVFDGSVLTGALIREEGWGMTQEGISTHDGRLYMSVMVDDSDNAYIQEILPSRPSLIFDETSKLHVAVPTFTSWTMSATAYRMVALTSLNGNNAAIGYDRAGYNSNNYRESLADDYDSAPGGDRWGVWNSTDGWVHASAQTYTADSPHRVSVSRNGTTSRTLWVDGASVVDSGVSQRPVSGDTLVIGNGRAYDMSEAFYGSITRVYLRNGALSDAWMAAEHLSWESPGDFYEVA